MIDASQIRSSFLEYMERNGHTRIPRASLVPNDPSTLFTGSGMQSLLPYLLGDTDPSGSRLVDSQPCLRAQDIADVGDNRHTTFFEMLGNWSLGEYFKEQQIRSFFEFLTEVVGLDPNRIYVTCFIGDEAAGIPRDDEAAAIWQEVFSARGIEANAVEIGSAAAGDQRGIRDGERIFFYDADQNWWSRGGGLLETPIGDPCGPDSEVFYDFGPEHQDPAYGLAHPASDGGQFLEIGNQVFMQYRRADDGQFVALERRNVDFGGGLERIAAAAQGVPDIYAVSVLAPLIQIIEDLSGRRYVDDPKPMRIIADHLRGAFFLATDGVRPSNKAQGYVMRRLLRRAISTARTIGLHDEFFAPIIAEIGFIYRDAFPEVEARGAEILAALLHEEQAFRKTLEGGLRALQRFQGRTITGQDIFMLSDTFGFPREITIEEAGKRGIDIAAGWEVAFAVSLQVQQEKSRGASKLGAHDNT